MMFAAIHLHGDICVLRVDGQSSIKLRAGSVQVTHAVDPNMIILSESGTEFHIEDDGSFKLLFPGDDVSTLEIEKPFIVETIVEEVAPADTPEISLPATSRYRGTYRRLSSRQPAQRMSRLIPSIALHKNDAADRGIKAGRPGQPRRMRCLAIFTRCTCFPLATRKSPKRSIGDFNRRAMIPESSKAQPVQCCVYRVVRSRV